MGLSLKPGISKSKKQKYPITKERVKKTDCRIHILRKLNAIEYFLNKIKELDGSYNINSPDFEKQAKNNYEKQTERITKLYKDYINFVNDNFKDSNRRDFLLSGLHLREKKEINEITLNNSTNTIMNQYELLYNTEAFFFEVQSFLDLLIRFITNELETDKVYFRWRDLKRLKPEDDYVKHLKRCWNEGIINDNYYSLKTFKEYRNSITHGKFLIYFIKQLSKYRLDAKGNVTEVKHLILPDNPKDDYGVWVTNKDIELVRFCDELYKIILSILRFKLDSDKLYQI